MKWYRVGSVGYLNAKPLVHELERSDVPLQVRFDVPSRCASLLHAGEIDVGLIPSIEYLAQPDYAIVPGVSIASNGPVASVLLLSKRPLERIERLAVDTSSRTSAALLKILCYERFGIRPSFQPASPELETMLATSDAALIIGDPALFTDTERLGLQVTDLGHEWKVHTGLPFVWAFWAGRGSVLGPDIAAALARARDRGVADIATIAATFGNGNPAVTRIAENYLRHHVEFRLDDAHEAALARFFESAARLEIVPRSQDLRFVGRQPQEVRG